MVQITGKYQHVSNSPNFEEYLKAVGTPDDILKPYLESKPTLTISESGGQWTIQSHFAGKDSTSTFKLGESYEEPLFPGSVITSVTKQEGDKLVTETTSSSGRGGTRVYEFSDAGLTIHLSDTKNNKASRTYKRI